MQLRTTSSFLWGGWDKRGHAGIPVFLGQIALFIGERDREYRKYIIAHNTLIMAGRYLRLMGDKTIRDSVETRLETFYPPFVAGIDLAHIKV